MRSLVQRAIEHGGVSAASVGLDVIGCSVSEFRAHIERQFLPGMTWENRRLWHIDHIVPLSSAATPEDVLALTHHTNLRPLWAVENLRKSDKITHLL